MSHSRIKPKNAKPPVADVWKAHDPAEPDDGGEDIVCPSGQTARVLMSPGIRGLVEMGVLDKMDSLSSIVETEVVGPKQGKAPKNTGAKVTKGDQDRRTADALMKDPAKLGDMLSMVDSVVVAVVIAPDVRAVPVAPDVREAGVVYVDRIMDGDKMFIFNHAVAGVRNLEQFRQELGELVDGMDDGEALEDPA